MSVLRRLMLALMAAAVAGLGGACSSSNPAIAVDTKSIEPGVAEQLNKVGYTVGSVDCPPGARPDPGATLACTVTLGDGKPLGLEVGVSSDGGRFTWKLSPDLVLTDALVGELDAFAKSAVSPDLAVTCPKAVIFDGGAGTLTCDVTDPAGQTAKVVVPVQSGRPVPDHDRWSIEQ